MKSITLLSAKDEGLYRIISPAVGYYFNIPPDNTFLSEGSSAGQLKILNTTYNLRLPPGVFGRVCCNGEMARAMPVQYQQELFSLQTDSSVLDQAMGGKDNGKPGKDLGETGTIITAFTTGIFYQRPSPDAPAFVAKGEEIRKGKVMGLIEVMKAFNHLVFQGADGDEEGSWIVKEILVEDAAEVRLGEALFVIEKMNE